ncbi:ATP-dependent zinc protease family protein [Aliivibrio kagoshimensis]|uniref:ATP-dependent zinc protease family protein n=1 Tax=Aliivibrio kagoshimensis TaxID=2910230 RepID=UPI003D0C26A2
MKKWPSLITLLLLVSVNVHANSNESSQGPHTVENVESKSKVLISEDGKLIFGEEEWVYFPKVKASFKARVDTGATTSSISAIDIESYKKDGKSWVKFKLPDADNAVDDFDLPVKRWVDIRQSSSDKLHRRAVVELDVQIGSHKSTAEFTLADREHLTFSVLLGRKYFSNVAIVDVGKQYVQPKVKK